MTRRNKKSRDEQQKIIEVPDIIEEELWSLSAWMEKHWKTVAMTLGGVSLVWGSLGIYQIFAAKSDQGRAEGSAGIFEKAGTPVVAPSDDPEKPEPKREIDTFDTDKVRAEAMIAAAKPDDQNAAALVGVLTGAAKATLGDREAQIKNLDVALATAKGSALELALREQKASALQAAGKSTEAAAEWAEVAKIANTDFGKTLAKVRTGDIFNGNVGSKAADAAKAKAAYEEAVKAARPGDKDPAPGPLAFLLADARGKLAKL